MTLAEADSGTTTYLYISVLESENQSDQQPEGYDLINEIQVF